MTGIREAIPEDARAIAAVHVAAHRETYARYFGTSYAAPDLGARQDLWGRALRGPGRAFVAVEDGEIVGFGHHLGAEITTLYLLAAWQRRGIGQRLLQHLAASIAAAGFADARLAVLARNEPAIAFYEAWGARRIGVATDPGSGEEDILFTLNTAACLGRRR